MYTFCLLFTTDSPLVCPEFTGLRVPSFSLPALPRMEATWGQALCLLIAYPTSRISIK